MIYPKISEHPFIALDTETTGINWLTEDLFGISVSTMTDDYYFDIRTDDRVLSWLREEVPKCPLIVNQNIGFDIHMLWNKSINIDPARVQCTMIRAALINEHLLQYNLDALAKKYLGKNKGKLTDIYQKLADMFGGKANRAAQMKNLHRAPESMVAPYAKQDTRVALELYLWQEEEIAKQGLQQVLDLEMRLFPHRLRMERHGIRVDLDEAARTTDRLTKEIKSTQKGINDMAGFPVNPNPSGSIHKLFEPKKGKDGKWQAVDGTLLPETEAGKASIGADQLRKMQHPAAAMILRCRKLMKTRDTFIHNHILGHAHGDRVHPTINQTKSSHGGNDEGTGTGRLSYTRPALQQIPSRDKDIAAIVRPIFLPDEGQRWFYGDLDQHEFRVFAHYVNAPDLTQAYREDPDLDIHGKIAALTGLPRNPKVSGGANAKQINLAMVFNMGGGALAEKMNLPFTVEEKEFKGVIREFKKPGPEAQDVIDRYFEAVPGVRGLARNAASVAKTRGYVRTLMGRHLRFPGGEFTYKASGLIFQGTSADLVKLDICNTCEYLEAECPDAHVLLSIHDELNISMLKQGAKTPLNKIQELVQTRPGAPKLRIPIRIDFCKPGKNWWEATNTKKIHD